MQLREGEEILKVYHHHVTPFVWNILKAIVAISPFYLLLFWLQDALPTKWYVITHLILFAFFAILVLWLSLIYWLDKLIITNHRIINIDWKFLTDREEAEAFLNDIQDIQTHEKGIFSYFRVFDFGTFRLDTASSRVTIMFINAPDPEGIRQFIYHVKNQ